MWEMLKQIHLNQTIIMAIQNLYSVSKSNVKIGNKLTKEFKVNKGM
jgi:hypothetical protein